MIVIGVIGFIGGGKGTVGEILQANGFVTESFAKPLKDAVSVIFGWDREMLEGATKESRAWRELKDEFWSAKLGKTITPRLVLQWMGTEAGRQVFGDALWTSALQNRLNKSKNYVITDVRFENEVAAVKEIGGHIVRVRRGDDPAWVKDAIKCKQIETERAVTKELTYLDHFHPSYEHIHRSEWDWINTVPDFTLTNDSTIWALRYSVFSMMDNINGERRDGERRVMASAPPHIIETIRMN